MSTPNKVTVEDQKNNVTVTDDGLKVVVADTTIKVVTVGEQGPAGSQEIGGKTVESNPSLDGGEFLIYNAERDRFEFVDSLDGGVI